MKVFVLGIDGLTFQIIDPWIEKGYLPNFARLKEQGSWGTLKSTIPPVTPAAWMSIATGLKPAKHGVLDFMDVSWRDNAVNLTPVTQRKSGKAIWNILSDCNYKVAVANVPCTYPPDPVNGIMVSGFSTPSLENSFTYPLEFQYELLRKISDYKIDITKAEQYTEYADNELLSLVHQMTDGRLKLLDFLLEYDDWDFVFFTLVGPDRLQHPLWHDLTVVESPQLIDYYQRLDDVLRQVIDWLGQDGLLFVVSDHGFRGVNRLCNLNQLLIKQGLAKTKPQVHLKNSIVPILDKLKLRKFLEPIYSAITAQSEQQNLASERLLASVAVNDSKAWAMAYAGSIYAFLFLSPQLPAIEQEQILATITTKLQEMGVVIPEDVFTGDALASALGLMDNSEKIDTMPQAILLARSPWGFQGRPRPGGVTQSIQTAGTHAMDGCLFMWGQGIRAGHVVHNASVYDIVPTILYALNLPIESDLDGQPLTNPFTTQYDVRIHDRKTGAIWGGEINRSDRVQKKIKDLLEKAP